VIFAIRWPRVSLSFRRRKGVKSALSSLRLIREKLASEDKESLFGSAANNPERKTRLQREIEATDREIDQLVRGTGLIFAIRWPRVSLGFRKPLRLGPDANFTEMDYALNIRIFIPLGRAGRSPCGDG